MTERTLEEIEAHIKAGGSSSIGYDLLAIAQGQREEIARLRHFGGKLSNLAFNLKQSDSIPDDHRQAMRIAQEDWDNASKPIGTKK